MVGAQDTRDKSASQGGIENGNISNQELLRNWINQLVENQKNEKYTHLL